LWPEIGIGARCAAAAPAKADRGDQMALTDLPVLNALKTKMHWLQTRQRVLAENVANADTPGYEAKDLRQPRFDDMVRAASVQSIGMARTSAQHIAGSSMTDTAAGFGTRTQTGWETTPSGNGVVLEEEMMKVTSNQMDYQTVSSLYAKSIAMLKIAVGGAG
jgi:flagellar basal-body rod protein FlgB